LKFIIKYFKYIFVSIFIVSIPLAWLNIGMSLNEQNVYYFYSTSAQAIATFIAFLIAGHAMVYQAMDNIESNDDSLRDINHQIKKEYHKIIEVLCLFTGLAISFCLLVIWLNGYSFTIKNYLIVLADFFIFLTIILALSFVVKMIDPDNIIGGV